MQIKQCNVEITIFILQGKQCNAEITVFILQGKQCNIEITIFILLDPRKNIAMLLSILEDRQSDKGIVPRRKDETSYQPEIHCNQGGLCLVMGEPGTGKSIIKEALRQKADKRMVVVSVNRTMHTYSNTLKILCNALSIGHEGLHVSCERRLIEQAYALNREGKSIVTTIDEAHLLDMDVMRKLRLLFEEFPKNHNLILLGQTEMLSRMFLKVNEDIKSRITFSTVLLKLISDDIEAFVLAQLDKCGLGHNVFTEEAISLITRSSDGILRRIRNLALCHYVL